MELNFHYSLQRNASYLFNRTRFPDSILSLFFFPFSLLLICPVWSQYSKGQLTFSCCPQRQTFSRYCSNPTISKLHPLSPKIPLGLSTEASPCKYVHRTDPRTLQQAENIWVLLTGLEQEGENALKVAPVFPVDLKGIALSAKAERSWAPFCKCKNLLFLWPNRT